MFGHVYTHDELHDHLFLSLRDQFIESACVWSNDMLYEKFRDAFNEQLRMHVFEHMQSQLANQSDLIANAVKLCENLVASVERSIENQFEDSMLANLFARVRDGHGRQLNKQLYNELECPLMLQLRNAVTHWKYINV